MLTAARLRDALASMPVEQTTGANNPSARTAPSVKSTGRGAVDAHAVDVSWTEHYPFPVFAKREADEPQMDGDSESDDAVGNYPPVVLKPHPLSADAVLQDSCWDRGGRDGVSQAGLGTPQLSSVPRARPSTAARTVAAAKASRPQSGSGSNGVSKPTVSKNEITALVSVFDPSNPLGTRVDLRHMDLQWIVRKKKARCVSPPAVHLHLGNVSASLNTASKDHEVLVNSPRSAIVLLRNGVTISDLKKQPGNLSTSVVEKKPFVTLDQLTWEQKKFLALETARLAKLREVVEEYRAVCQSISFDDIVAFCSAYQPEKPSSASLLTLASDTSDKGWSRRSPEAQCADRLRALVDRFERREERINRSTALLHGTMEEERREIVDRLVRAEQRAQSAVDSRLEHVRSMGIASRGRSELWRAQRQRHDRVDTFQLMVTRENLQRRLDEVSCVQAGMKNTIAMFQDRVRRQNVAESMVRESNHTAFLRRAKQMFLETQK